MASSHDSRMTLESHSSLINPYFLKFLCVKIRYHSGVKAVCYVQLVVSWKKPVLMKIYKILVVNWMSHERGGFQSLTSRLIAVDYFRKIWWIPVGIGDRRRGGMFRIIIISIRFVVSRIDDLIGRRGRSSHLAVAD